ncbi:MAG TPA: lipopolysaccharide heptosyltransferase II [Verrucomicrobiota bacterium]|nr:lipopolysaccharide heptosyltransferase II [Verrucomicrobiales bacterium]HRI14703.1 lipopolysaccharide heptosyltransferase II [Verrucomicrobiota bacterium]
MSQPPAPPAPLRILVRGVNWLGDAVMTTPALLRLRERFPAAEISLLTPAKLKDLWVGHPALNRILDFSASQNVFSVAARLRAEHFDLAVILPNSPRSALEAFVAGIPRRVGGRWPWRDWLLTKSVEPASNATRMRKRTVEEIRALTSANSKGPQPSLPDPAAHQMYHYLRVVAAVGADPTPLAPRLTTTLAEIEAVRIKYGFRPGSAWLGINPGAEYGPAKRWPIERFAAAADALRQEFDCGIAVFGGLADLALAEELAEQLQTAAPTLRILAGKTTLRELLAALMCCRVVLTNDTGPMHVAAALGVPVVVPFGSTSSTLTGPGLPGDPQHQLLQSAAACSPCFLRTCPIDFRCMLGIDVDRVVQAVRTAWRVGQHTDQ